MAMRAFYGSLQLLVVPSLWFEAWGRVVTEAQLNGIPVLGTDRGGLPEVLSEPPIAVRQWALEPWKDPVITTGIARQLADAIARIREPAAYQDAVVRGYEKAQETQKRARASVDHLEQVLRGHATAS
jgi:glycosyltransferase involved in cell wall biosynthesis